MVDRAERAPLRGARAYAASQHGVARTVAVAVTVVAASVVVVVVDPRVACVACVAPVAGARGIEGGAGGAGSRSGSCRVKG